MRKKKIIQYYIDIELYTTPYYPNLKIYFKDHKEKKQEFILKLVFSLLDYKGGKKYRKYRNYKNNYK